MRKNWNPPKIEPQEVIIPHCSEKVEGAISNEQYIGTFDDGSGIERFVDRCPKTKQLIFYLTKPPYDEIKVDGCQGCKFYSKR